MTTTRMRLFLNPVAILTAALSPFSCFAGWVSSGGGSLVSDSGNPWWVQNTKIVRYCIEIDTTSISAGRSAIEEAVIHGLNYWKTEAEFVRQSFPSTAQVANQEFRRQECSEDTELKIQFGSGTLSPQQVQYFGYRLPRIIGEAVRTEYDLVRLAGKGFVYFASDVGIHSNGKKAWSSVALLKRMVIHELGHIFGLAHLDNSIMAEDGPNLWYSEVPTVPAQVGSFSSPGQHIVTCGLPGARFFRDEIPLPPTSWPCLVLKLNQYKMEVYSFANGHEEQLDFLGTIKFEALQRGSSSLGQVVLNPEQKVFDDTSHHPSIDLMLIQNEYLSGVFTSKLGFKRAVNVELSGARRTIVGHVIRNEQDSFGSIEDVLNEVAWAGDWWDSIDFPQKNMGPKKSKKLDSKQVSIRLPVKSR